MKTPLGKIIVIVCILSTATLTSAPFTGKKAQADDWVKTVWTVYWTCYEPKPIGRGWRVCGYKVTDEEDVVEHTSRRRHKHPRTQYKDCDGHSYGNECPCDGSSDS